jgi:hypothetical protein
LFVLQLNVSEGGKRSWVLVRGKRVFFWRIANSTTTNIDRRGIKPLQLTTLPTKLPLRLSPVLLQHAGRCQRHDLVSALRVLPSDAAWPEGWQRWEGSRWWGGTASRAICDSSPFVRLLLLM